MFAQIARILTFRATLADFERLENRHLAVGLVAAWLVGMGRYWDNPRVGVLQHAGVGSVVYCLPVVHTAFRAGARSQAGAVVVPQSADLRHPHFLSGAHLRDSGGTFPGAGERTDGQPVVPGRRAYTAQPMDHYAFHSTPYLLPARVVVRPSLTAGNLYILTRIRSRRKMKVHGIMESLV